MWIPPMGIMRLGVPAECWEWRGRWLRSRWSDWGSPARGKSWGRLASWTDWVLSSLALDVMGPALSLGEPAGVSWGRLGLWEAEGPARQEAGDPGGPPQGDWARMGERALTGGGCLAGEGEA